jgi:two-component system, OmpR family, sensor histidine kinase CiaH
LVIILEKKIKMKQNSFHNASIKLASFYLMIIVVISLVFSFSLYNVSSNELERGIRRQTGPVGQVLRNRNVDLIEDLLLEQNQTISEAQARLRNNLFIINLLILVSGGLLSYYLARRSLQPIEEAHEAQSRFTADASHELRTPITAMRVETELTLTDKKLTLQKAREQLKSNIEELDKLTNLSAGLLQLARIDNNGLETSKTDIKDIVNTAVSTVLPHAESKKQLINTKKLKTIIINANEISLTEALVTVLDNAIKYSPVKSVITITTLKTKQHVKIMISDNGVGIKALDLPHIFERFYRVDQSRNKTLVSGYGLGLSIAKAVVEAHKGNITVSSIPNKGSTFTVSLPIKN